VLAEKQADCGLARRKGVLSIDKSLDSFPAGSLLTMITQEFLADMDGGSRELSPGKTNSIR